MCIQNLKLTCFAYNKIINWDFIWFIRKSHPEMFLGKDVLEICSKFTGEHPCQSAISITLQSNFIEITLRHGCSPLNLSHIFRTSFLKKTSGWLLLIHAFPFSLWKRENAAQVSKVQKMKFSVQKQSPEVFFRRRCS